VALSKANNMGYQIISGYIGRYVYWTQYQALECVDMVFVRVCVCFVLIVRSQLFCAVAWVCIDTFLGFELCVER